jgi:hypothetical protein
MRRAHAFLLASVGAFSISAGACGGKVVLDGGGAAGAGATSTGTGPSSTGTGAGACASGGSAPGGDCTADADCNGGTCAPIAPGGYLLCLDVVPEATSCTTPINGTNQCCTSADCHEGQCYSTGSLPYCGGPAPPLYNTCITDACTTDDDCPATAGAPSQACLPAGAYGEPMRTCYPAYCHTNADCTAHPCGVCAPVVGPCCSTAAGLGCVYPGGCKTNADCGEGTSCELDPETGTGACVSDMGGTCPV